MRVELFFYFLFCTYAKLDALLQQNLWWYVASFHFELDTKWFFFSIEGTLASTIQQKISFRRILHSILVQIMRYSTIHPNIASRPWKHWLSDRSRFVFCTQIICQLLFKVFNWTDRTKTSWTLVVLFVDSFKWINSTWTSRVNQDIKISSMFFSLLSLRDYFCSSSSVR